MDLQIPLLVEQLFKHVSSAKSVELDEELQRLSYQQQECIKAARNTIAHVISNRKKSATDTNHSESDCLSDDLDAGIIDDDDDVEDIYKDIERFVNASNGEIGDTKKMSAVRERVAASGKREAQRDFKQEIDLSLQQLLSSNVVDRIDMRSLKDDRTAYNDSVLSLPDPMDMAFTERSLMSELNAASLRQFVGDVPEVANKTGRSRSQSATTRQESSPVNVDDIADSLSDRIATGKISIQDRVRMSNAAIEWYRYTLGIVSKTFANISNHDSHESYGKHMSIVTALNSCRRQIEYIESRIAELTRSANTSGSSTGSSYKTDDHLQAKDTVRFSDRKQGDISHTQAQPDSAVGHTLASSLVCDSDLVFIVHAMTYRHSSSLIVNRLLTRIKTFLPICLSTKIFNDATDAVAKGTAVPGWEANAIDNIVNINHASGGSNVKLPPENIRNGNLSPTMSVQSHVLNTPFQSSRKLTGTRTDTILESEMSLIAELNSLVMKITNSSATYDNPTFSVKLLFDDCFIKHCGLANVTRASASGNATSSSKTSTKDVGKAEAERTDELSTSADMADQEEDEKEFGKQKRYHIAGLTLKSDSASWKDVLQNYEIVPSSAFTFGLLPPPDTSWLDVGIVDDIRDPIFTDDTTVTEQRFLLLTNYETVCGRLSEIAADGYKNSKLSSVKSHEHDNYRAGSPTLNTRSASPTTANATPLTNNSRAGTPLANVRSPLPGHHHDSAAPSSPTPTVKTINRGTPTEDDTSQYKTTDLDGNRQQLLNRVMDFFTLRFVWIREVRYRLFFDLNVQTAIVHALAQDCREPASDASFQIEIIRKARHDSYMSDSTHADEVPLVMKKKATAQSDASRKAVLIFEDTFKHVTDTDDRLVNIASSTIRKWRQSNEYTTPDRVCLLQELYELEMALNHSRTKLMEAYYFVYKNTVGSRKKSNRASETESVDFRDRKDQLARELVSIAKREPVLSDETIDVVAGGRGGEIGRLFNSYMLLTKSFDDEREMVTSIINVAIGREYGIRQSTHNDRKKAQGNMSSVRTSIEEEDYAFIPGIPPPIMMRPVQALNYLMNAPMKTPMTTTPIGTPLANLSTSMQGNESDAVLQDKSLVDVYDASLSLLSHLPGVMRDITKRIRNNYCGSGGGVGEWSSSNTNTKLLGVAIHHIVISNALQQWKRMRRDEIAFQYSKSSEPGADTFKTTLRGEDTAFDCATCDMLLKHKKYLRWTLAMPAVDPDTSGLLECIQLLRFSSFRISVMNSKYESHVLTAAYAAISRCIGIRVHSVVMPPLDFENQRLTPSSFQALEEDRGDFEELDVNACLVANLSDHITTSTSTFMSSTSRSLHSNSGVADNNDTEFSICEWDNNLWNMNMMNSIVDIAKALSKASPTQTLSSNIPAGQTSSNTAMSFFSILARVELMQYLQAAAYRIALDHNHLLVLVVDKAIIRKRVALSLRQWRRRRYDSKKESHEQAQMSSHLKSSVAPTSYPYKQEDYELLLRGGVSLQSMLLTRNDHESLKNKRVECASMVSPLWLSPNKLKYKLRGMAMRSYATMIKKVDANNTSSTVTVSNNNMNYETSVSASNNNDLYNSNNSALQMKSTHSDGNLTALLTGNASGTAERERGSESSASTDVDLTHIRIKLKLFDDFYEKLVTDLRIYSMKTQLAFTSRCLNKLIVGAVNAGCTQPFFTTNNHFGYTSPSADPNGDSGVLHPNVHGNPTGLHQKRHSIMGVNRHANNANSKDPMSKKKEEEELYRQRRITTKASRHALRDAGYVFDVDPDLDLELDSSGIDASTGATRSRVNTTDENGADDKDADPSLNEQKVGKGGHDPQHGIDSDDDREIGHKTITPVTRLSSGSLFDGLLSPFEILSSKNHLPTLKNYLECTTAIVDIAYILASFMLLSSSSTPVPLHDLNLNHDDAAEFASKDVAGGASTTATGRVLYRRKCRMSFDIGQSLSKEQYFDLMKQMYSIKQEIIRSEHSATQDTSSNSLYSVANAFLVRRREEVIKSLLVVYEDAALQLQFETNTDNSKDFSYSRNQFAAAYLMQICANVYKGTEKHGHVDEEFSVNGYVSFPSPDASIDCFLQANLHSTHKLYRNVDYDALCLMTLSEKQRQVVSSCRSKHAEAMLAVLQESHLDQINNSEKCVELNDYYITVARLHTKLLKKFYSNHISIVERVGHSDTTHAPTSDNILHVSKMYTNIISNPGMSLAGSGSASTSPKVHHHLKLKSPKTKASVKSKEKIVLISTPTIGRGVMTIRKMEAEVHLLKMELDFKWLQTKVEEIQRQVMSFFMLGSTNQSQGGTDLYTTFEKDTVAILRSSLSTLSGIIETSHSGSRGVHTINDNDGKDVNTGSVIVRKDMLLDWIMNVLGNMNSIFRKDMSVRESLHIAAMNKLHSHLISKIELSEERIRKNERELDGLQVTKDLDVSRSCLKLVIEVEDLRRTIAMKDEEFAEQRLGIEQAQHRRYAKEITDLKKQVKALQYHNQLKSEQVQEHMITVLHDLRKETTMRFAEREERATGEISNLRTTMEAEEHVVKLQNELFSLKQSLLQIRTLHTMQLMSRESKYSNDIKHEQQLTKKAQRELYDTRDQFVMRNSMLSDELHATRMALIKSQTNLSELKLTITNLEKRRDKLLKWKVDHSKNKTESIIQAKYYRENEDNESEDSMLISTVDEFDFGDGIDSHSKSARSTRRNLIAESVTETMDDSRVRRESPQRSKRVTTASSRVPLQSSSRLRRPSTAPIAVGKAKTRSTRECDTSCSETQHQHHARNQQVYAATGVKDRRGRTYELNELKHLESRLIYERNKNKELTKKLEKSTEATTNVNVNDHVGSDELKDVIHAKMNKSLLKRGFSAGSKSTRTSGSGDHRNIIKDEHLFDLHSSALASPVPTSARRSAARSYINPNVVPSNDSWKNKYLHLKAQYQGQLQRNEQLTGTLKMMTAITPKDVAASVIRDSFK